MSEVKNIYGKEAIQKLQAMADQQKTGILCFDVNSYPLAVCPMYIQTVDGDGDLWFFSPKDSEHNKRIARDGRVQFFSVNTGDSAYFSLAGEAEIVHDPAKVEELWNPMAKVWFQGGKDDPNLSLLRICPRNGYYWDTKTNRMVEFLKMAASVVSGKTMDDGVQGKMKLL
jgi:general stress protein 26